jgi:hypothetical protein
MFLLNAILDLTNYKMFAHTVWSDNMLAKIILEIMDAFKIIYVREINSKTKYD